LEHLNRFPLRGEAFCEKDALFGIGVDFAILHGKAPCCGAGGCGAADGELAKLEGKAHFAKRKRKKKRPIIIHWPVLWVT